MDATAQFFEKPISEYTTEQAINDGVLAPVGRAGGIQIILTTNLIYSKGLDNEETGPARQKALVEQGLKALEQPCEEDRDNGRLFRTIEFEGTELFVINDMCGIITIMLTDDY